MFFIIYKTTCLINNKYYIGMHKTDNIDDGYLGSGKLISRSIRKYGAHSFKREILHYCNSIEEMKLKEAETVTPELLEDPLCLNLTCGGHGGFYYANQVNTEEHMRTIRKKSRETYKRKLQEDPEYKSRFSNTAKNNMTKLRQNSNFVEIAKKNWDWTGRKHSNETKEKISKILSEKSSGSGNSNYGNKWMYHPELKINERVPKNQIESKQIEGWILGRKIKWD